MPKWYRDGIWVVKSNLCHGEFWAQYFDKIYESFLDKGSSCVGLKVFFFGSNILREFYESFLNRGSSHVGLRFFFGPFLSLQHI